MWLYNLLCIEEVGNSSAEHWQNKTSQLSCSCYTCKFPMYLPIIDLYIFLASWQSRIKPLQLWFLSCSVFFMVLSLLETSDKMYVFLVRLIETTVVLEGLKHWVPLSYVLFMHSFKCKNICWLAFASAKKFRITQRKDCYPMVIAIGCEVHPPCALVVPWSWPTAARPSQLAEV